MRRLAVDRWTPEEGESSTKRRKTTAAEDENHKNTEANGKDKSKVRPLSMSLEDPDLLDCPICFEPLSSPVYQCKNGHIACAACCTTTLKNKCSTCLLPIENIRCRAIENILASLRVKCQYKVYGCSEKLSYSNKVAHGKACTYVPCSCPLSSRCDFVGTSKHVYHHFAVEHKGWYHQLEFNTKFSISPADITLDGYILREGTTGVLFVLYPYTRALGSFYNIVCVAPSASEPRFLYELTATMGDDSIKVETSVEMMPKWTEQPPTKMSPLVPSELISTSQQQLKLDLIIMKKPAPVT